MNKPKYLISACLCGEKCRYDSGAFDYPSFKELVKDGLAIPFCPEVAGGLPVPRKPCEIVANRVLAADGTDCTREYEAGAQKALALCQKYGISAVILKDSSPSCGVKRIYDGTHTGKKIPGQGITAKLLSQAGIVLFTEMDFCD